MNMTLEDFPTPPSDRSGWPWTDANPQLPQKRPDGSEWPRITIVTPSYNQGQYIEETIRSILLQGYPNLEYFVMDGGSTDSSVDVILKYACWIDYWESEPDEGQAHAINKGLRRATGKIFQWINSDDFLEPNALWIMGRNWSDHTTAISGSVTNFGCGETLEVVQSARISKKAMIRGYPNCVYHQPGIWLATEKMKEIGLLEEDLDYVFDSEMMIRYLDKFPEIKYVEESLVRFRLHSAAKTSMADTFYRDEPLRLLRAVASNRDLSRSVRKSAARELVKREYFKISGIIISSKCSTILKLARLIIAARSQLWFDRFFWGSVRRALSQKRCRHEKF